MQYAVSSKVKYVSNTRGAGKRNTKKWEEIYYEEKDESLTGCLVTIRPSPVP
jgi:hypothetical protein